MAPNYNRRRIIVKLILFDIDSTLVRVERRVTHALTTSLLAAVDYHDELRDYELHGKTDRQVIRELREVAGVQSDDGPDRTEMESMILRHWRAHLDSSSVSLLPGVRPLLDELAERDDVAIGVLTGNLEEAAWLKLAIHDLARYFPFGAFGSDADNRVDLPPIALERARDVHGAPFDYGSTLIVGDSNRDIECAHAWGIRALAVATGALDLDTLRSHGPEGAAENLFDRSYLDTFLRE